jgi:hypothetical protein
MKVMASEAGWQATNALVKQSSRGWGLLGVVVVVVPVVVAVILPQFSVVEAGVPLCVGVCVAVVCEGDVAVAAATVGAFPVVVAAAVAVPSCEVWVVVLAVELHPESVRTSSIPAKSNNP